MVYMEYAYILKNIVNNMKTYTHKFLDFTELRNQMHSPLRAMEPCLRGISLEHESF